MPAVKERPKVELGKINKLSVLLALALNDLIRFMRMRNHKIEMNAVWLHVNDSCEPVSEFNPCEACLAGAVMYLELACPPQSNPEPQDYDEAVSCRLMALNLLRMGAVGMAAQKLGIKTKVRDRYIPKMGSYDPREKEEWKKGMWRDWRKSMRRLLKDLKEAGE